MGLRLLDGRCRCSFLCRYRVRPGRSSFAELELLNMTEIETPILDLEPVEPRASRAQSHELAVSDNSPASMMLKAMGQGASLEQVEKMMELQERWEAGEARKAYNTAFAEFKAEAVHIVKNRKVTDGPLKGKSYAELHSVVDALTPALSRHGLSASWKLTKDDKDWMEVTCYLRHIRGHEESVSMGGPPDVGGAKNAIQARASTKSYLERYTLKAICGVAEGGDDDDGQGGPQAAQEQADGLLQAGRDASMKGMVELTAWWGKLSAKDRGRLQKDFAGMRRAALEADRAR
jgi:hypothetical protein